MPSRRNPQLRHPSERKRRKAPSPYDELPDDVRSVVNCFRRHLATNLAAADGLPLDQTLEGITALHERGHLALVVRNGRVALVPSINGHPLDDGFDFETAHHTRGGRS